MMEIDRPSAVDPGFFIFPDLDRAQPGKELSIIKFGGASPWRSGCASKSRKGSRMGNRFEQGKVRLRETNCHGTLVAPNPMKMVSCACMIAVGRPYFQRNPVATHASTTNPRNEATRAHLARSKSTKRSQARPLRHPKLGKRPIICESWIKYPEYAARPDGFTVGETSETKPTRAGRKNSAERSQASMIGCWLVRPRHDSCVKARTIDARNSSLVGLAPTRIQ